MSRPFVFPDPDDRSKNNPAVIVTSEQVIGLYNQYNENGEEVQRVSGTVKKIGFTKEATRKSGLDDAKFVGSQCILEK